jgi:hypothetical protein
MWENEKILNFGFNKYSRKDHTMKQLLFLYSWFYKVTMLESTNATGEEKMQMYL